MSIGDGLDAKNVLNHGQKLELFPGHTQDTESLAINHTFNIRRRTCNTFIPRNTTGSDLRCGCKRLRREHSWEVLEGDTSKWTKDKHTQPAVTNAWGFLPQSESRYIRCDIETKPSTLVQFMFDFWRMPSPRLIMCIIGGAKYFKLNERLEKEFIKGIIQAALKADAWIVTSGFKTGVVQLVGEAINDHKVTNRNSRIIAVGCSKWGATRNRDALIRNKESHRNKFDFNSGNTKVEKGQQFLEPNHTHFLLLDDGTYYGYDIGDYRTQLVKEISLHKNENVPIVTIVVEGGPDTLSAICKDLHNDIPVVLIDGSGRVPNLLANFLTRTETMLNRTDKKNDENNDWKEVIDVKEREKLRNLFSDYEEEIRDGVKSISKGGKSSSEDIDALFYEFLYCLQPAVRIKIRVFSLQSDRDLDDTIFEAIIQTKQKKTTAGDAGPNREQLLQLALAWDALSVAKEYIIKEDLNDLNVKSREGLFFTALRLDRPSFVQTFIKLNFGVAAMFYEVETNKPWRLKWANLKGLYNDKNQKGRLCLLDKCLGKDGIQSPFELDRLLRILIGDYMKPIYSHSIKEDPGCTCRCPLRRGRVSDSRASLQSTDDNEQYEEMNPEEIQKSIDELVYRDLFLWSILTNRIEMSKVFLNQLQTRICACLIASKIFKSYFRYANDNESKDILSSQANEFEEYAYESLKHCYHYDEEKACEIAIRYIDLFGGVSCLQVAVDADDKNFVGQPCCDQLLNNVWYDKMEPFQSTMSKRLRLLVSIGTFGLTAPFLISFRKEHPLLESSKAQIKSMDLKINETQQEEKNNLRIETMKRLKDYGINYSDTYMSRARICSKSLVNYLHQLKYFHQSPIVKYAYNSVSYLVFLLFFSYYLLFDFFPLGPNAPMMHWTEILVIIIITSMLIEDFRQFLCQEHRSISGKLSNYFINNYFFNLIRVLSYLLFYIGLILRCIRVNENQDTFAAAKIILAYDLEIWFIRSFTFLGIAQKMGPKLVMIRRMIIDLFFFTYIILIAMTAYGVASRTMFNYTTSPISFDGRSIFRNLIYPTYYLMYGNIGGELTSLDANPDSSSSIATHVLLAFHMLFVNILLINLLIAMFSFTFESVQTQTDLVWRYERYSLIREYYDRPPLFPPLILATHFLELIKMILRFLPNISESYRNRIRPRVFKMVAMHRKIDNDWSEFETCATNHYIRSLITNQPSFSSSATSNRRPDQLSPSIYSNSSVSPTANVDVKAITEEMSSLRKAVLDLRTQSEEMFRCIQWMMDAMERVKMSREPKPKLQPATDANE